MATPAAVDALNLPGAPAAFFILEMRNDYPAKLKREFISAAVVIGAVLLGTLVLHYFIS